MPDGAITESFFVSSAAKMIEKVIVYTFRRDITRSTTELEILLQSSQDSITHSCVK